MRRKSASSARGARPGMKGGDMKKAKTRSQREPSVASPREIPEVDFSKSRIRRNPYAARVAREGLVVQIGRGRPGSCRRHAATVGPLFRGRLEADRGGGARQRTQRSRGIAGGDPGVARARRLSAGAKSTADQGTWVTRASST